jgi:hypothetical protein
MDTTHINRIGHHLSQLSIPPCCYPKKAQASVSFDPTPSRLTYHQLVDQLPCFHSTDPSAPSPLPSRHHCWNLKTNYDRWHASNILTHPQNTAISTFRALYTKLTEDPDSHDITLADVEIFATCFDDLLFSGWVLHRCSIHFYTDPPVTHAGEVQPVHTCPTHQQCHTMHILLTRPSPCPSASPETRRRRLDYLLGLLLHELCHAYIAIFASWHHRTIEDALIEHGPTAHGLAWENVMKMACWAVDDFLGLQIDEDTWLECPADGDAEVVGRMLQLDNWIENVKPEKEALERQVGEELGVGMERAGGYDGLLGRGFGRLEVLGLIWGWGVVEAGDEG